MAAAVARQKCDLQSLQFADEYFVRRAAERRLGFHPARVAQAVYVIDPAAADDREHFFSSPLLFDRALGAARMR